MDNIYRDRRASKRSGHYSLGSSIDTYRSKLSLGSAERKVQKILEDEEHELIVYFVREELLTHIINKCYERYLERQCVDFTVHCSYRALKQFVDIGCYMHDPGQPYYIGHPAWSQDEVPLPSPPDTWAAHRADIKPKPIPIPLPLKVCSSEIDDKEVKFVTDSIILNNAFGVKDEKVEILYDSQLRNTERQEYESELGLIGPPGSVASSTKEVYGINLEDLEDDEEEEEGDDEVYKLSEIQENLSFFTRLAKAPVNDLPGSLKSAQGLTCNPPKGKGKDNGKGKSKRHSKAAEPTLVSLDELFEKNQLSVRTLPPLRASDGVIKTFCSVCKKLCQNVPNVFLNSHQTR